MTEDEPAGVVVTLREIHDNVQLLAKDLSIIGTKVSNMVDFRKELDEHDKRLRKMEAQNAAHWVVHTLALAGITTMIGRLFT